MRNKAPAPKDQALKGSTKRLAVHGSLRIFANSKFAYDAIWRLATAHNLERSGLSVSILQMHFSKLKKKNGRVELTVSRWDGVETLAKLFGTNVKNVGNRFSSLYSDDLLSFVKWGTSERCYAYSIRFVLWLKRESERLRIQSFLRDADITFKAIQLDSVLTPSLCLLCPTAIFRSKVNSSSRGVEGSKPDNDNSSSRGVDESATTHRHDDRSNSTTHRDDELLGATTHRHAESQLIVTMMHSNSIENSDSEKRKEEEEELKIEDKPPSASVSSLESFSNSDKGGKVISITRTPRHLERHPFFGTMKEHGEERRRQVRMDSQSATMQGDVPKNPRLDTPSESDARSVAGVALKIREWPQEARNRYLAIMPKLITKNERQRLPGSLPEMIFQLVRQLASSNAYDDVVAEIDGYLEGDDSQNIHGLLLAHAKENMGGNIGAAWKQFLKNVIEKHLQKK